MTLFLFFKYSENIFQMTQKETQQIDKHEHYSIEITFKFINQDYFSEYPDTLTQL